MQSDNINYSTLLGITDELLLSKDNVKLYVGGNSMYPHLRKKDYVTITKTPFDELKKGDVIVFKGFLKFIAHRIIKIVRMPEEIQVITKGDSCRKSDTPISQDKYIGKIISFERNGHYRNLESLFFNRYNFFLACISLYTPVVDSFVRFFKHLFRSKK